MFSPVIPEQGEGERGLASSSTSHNTNLLTTVKKLVLTISENSKKCSKTFRQNFCSVIILCHVSQNHRLKSSVAEPKLFLSASAPTLTLAPRSRKSELRLQLQLRLRLQPWLRIIVIRYRDNYLF
jgi:hypothetical protein